MDDKSRGDGGDFERGETAKNFKLWSALGKRMFHS